MDVLRRVAQGFLGVVTLFLGVLFLVAGIVGSVEFVSADPVDRSLFILVGLVLTGVGYGWIYQHGYGDAHDEDDDIIEKLDNKLLSYQGLDAVLEGLQSFGSNPVMQGLTARSVDQEAGTSTNPQAGLGARVATVPSIPGWPIPGESILVRAADGLWYPATLLDSNYEGDEFAPDDDTATGDYVDLKYAAADEFEDYTVDEVTDAGATYRVFRDVENETALKQIVASEGDVAFIGTQRYEVINMAWTSSKTGLPILQTEENWRTDYNAGARLARLHLAAGTYLPSKNRSRPYQAGYESVFIGRWDDGELMGRNPYAEPDEPWWETYTGYQEEEVNHNHADNEECSAVRCPAYSDVDNAVDEATQHTGATAIGDKG